MQKLLTLKRANCYIGMRLHLIVLLLHICSSLVSAQDYDGIRQELEHYLTESITLRQAVRPTIKNYGYESEQMDSLNQIISRSDSVSLIRIKAIIDEYGWLGISDIGIQANQSLYLAIQHGSDEDRKKYFPLLKASAEEGESDKSAMATMWDRMLVHEGKEQKYGTQSHMKNGSLVLYPIEDERQVNKLRKSVGLPKLKQFR